MEIEQSFQSALDSFVGFLPNLIGFLILLLVGYVVARVVATIVRKLLTDGLKLDQHLRDSDANKHVEKVMPGASPSNGIARLIFWFIFIFFITAAVSALGIPAITGFMNQVLSYLPNVIVAIVIFIVAALVAGAATAGITKVMGDTPTGKIAATVVPALVMVIALFMILNQLKIAEEIVIIAFAATMGALALGLALAFGLGGREVARRLLEDAYAKGGQAKEQARADIEQGRSRVEDRTDSSSGASYEATGPRTAPPVDPPTQQYPTDPGRPGAF